MDLYRLTIQDSQDSMQFDLLDAPIKIEDVEGAVDNTVLTGDIFTDYLFLKKRWEQKWAIMCKDEYERLRGFYTRQWSLATVPSVKVTQGYLENASWEGQIFYINAPYGGEVSSLTRMTGDTFQQAISGKNLVGLTDNTISQSGLTATVEGDTITIDGTATGIVNLCSANFNLDGMGGKKLAVSILPISGSWTGGSVGFSLRNSSDSQVFFQQERYDGANFNANTITSSALASADHAFIFAGATTVFSNFKFKIMLSDSPVIETTYIPFVGGIPSPNPQYPQAIRTVTGEQTISVNGTDFKINLGKNLFDKDNPNVITAYLNNSNIFTQSAGARTIYIKCAPNTTYTIQKTNQGTNQRFCIFTAEVEPSVGTSAIQVVGTRAGLDTHDSYTITTEHNARWIGAYVMASSTTPTESEILATVQIEEGSVKTDYASYITPIELVRLGDAQDSFYFNGSDWILRKENAKHYFTTASGAGSTWEGTRHRMYFTVTWQTANGINLATHTDTLTPAQILADKFVSLSFDDLYNNDKDGIALSTSTTLSIRNNNWNDATTARSEIVGTTMYYALATPTETTITDATLISQLNAIQAALQEGQNTVAVTANGSNLPAKTITLNGIAGREKPVLAQTNVRIGLSDGGVLNACECRQNVTLSMRETA